MRFYVGVQNVISVSNRIQSALNCVSFWSYRNALHVVYDSSFSVFLFPLFFFLSKGMPSDDSFEQVVLGPVFAGLILNRFFPELTKIFREFTPFIRYFLLPVILVLAATLVHHVCCNIHLGTFLRQM